MRQADLQAQLGAFATRSDVPADAKAAIDKALSAPDPLRSDFWIYRIVVAILGLTAFATVAGGIYIAAVGNGDAAVKLPDAIVAIGSAAVGALAGLLAPAPKQNS